MTNSVIADAVLIHNNKILLVQQKKQSSFGLWGLPGGHVEQNESIDQALKRELIEEIGYEIDLNLIIQRLNHTEKITKVKVLKVTTFVAEVSHIDVTIQKNELLNYGWFSLDELKKLEKNLRSSWILPLANKYLK